MIIKRHPDINCKVNPVWWPETLHPQPPPSLHFKIMRCKFFPNMHKFLGILSLAHHVRVRDVNIWRRWSQVLVDLWNFGEGDKESWECRRVGGELMAHVLNVITGPDGLKRTKMTAPPSPACKHLSEDFILHEWGINALFTLFCERTLDTDLDGGILQTLLLRNSRNFWELCLKAHALVVVRVLIGERCQN